VRVLNVARGPLVVDADLQAALDSGKVAGAALDVFQTEPITEHPLFAYPNVIVTPHLGASTAEANDREGYQAAEQIVAALTGGAVTTAVNIPAIPEDDLEALTPFLPLARSLGKIAASLADAAGTAVDGVKAEFLGGIAARDTRLLALNVLIGVLAAQGAEDLNEVSAPGLAQQRGITIDSGKQTTTRDYTDLIRVTVTSGEHTASVAGTVIGNLHRPHLLEAWGQRFQVQLDEHVTMFRYRDQPGMLGRVGTLFGQGEVNIVSSIVGRQPDGVEGGAEPLAAMVITTDVAVPDALVAEIASSDGFELGVSVDL
jgi:D-3-phosphoglycerate dehydrogenase